METLYVHKKTRKKWGNGKVICTVQGGNGVGTKQEWVIISLLSKGEVVTPPLAS